MNLPGLDTTRLWGEGNSSIRQVLGDGVREHVLRVAELEDARQVDVTGHDVLLDKLARGVKALLRQPQAPPSNPIGRECSCPKLFTLTFSW